MMGKDIKDKIMLTTACVTLASGIVLSFLSFFLSLRHEIDSSVLMYFAQTLVYAGSCFGIGAYLRTKLNDIQNNLNH